MRAPVLWLPLVALAPLQPPEAVQEVALVEVHVNVETPPLPTEVGAALKDAVGAGTCTLSVGFTRAPHAATSSNALASTLRIRNRL
jgi:hypothetical protein